MTEPIKVPQSKTWGEKSIYEIHFKNRANVPDDAYILVNVPEPLTITNETLLVGNCSDENTTCERFNETAFIIHINRTYSPDDLIYVEVGGLRNPRSLRPTGRWSVGILDPEKKGFIGEGYMGRAKVTEPG